MTPIESFPILSASRRTDIPAFYAKRFIDALLTKKMWGKPHIIFFWSKNYAPLLEYLPLIVNEGIKCVFQYTLNNYPVSIEPHVPDIHQRIETFHKLKEFGTPIWRYDPICYSRKSGSHQLREWHLNNIEAIANELEPEKLIISFLDGYGKVFNACEKANLRSPTPAEQQDFCRSLVRLVNDNFPIFTCAEAGEFTGIAHSACIDPELIEKLCPKLGHITKDPAQRKLCGCAKSFDIGAYHTCKHGCVYCYAA